MVKPIKESEMPVPSETMAEVKHQFADYCISLGKTGTFNGYIRASKLPSGSHNQEGGNEKTERFLLEIPYVNDILHWYILFDSQEPESPPQFIFCRATDTKYERSDGSFLKTMDSEALEKLLPSLANWDSTDQEALANVVEELLFAFRKYQLNALREMTDQSVAFKVINLLESQTVAESDIELIIRAGNEVNLLVRLAVDMSKVPELLLPPLDRRQREILASVLFTLVGDRQTSKLVLSPRMQLILGQEKDVKFPNIQADRKQTLPEYVEMLRKQLDRRIGMVVGGVNHRKNFLTSLVGLMGRALIETDTKNFTKSTFLLEWNNFSFLVHCCVPLTFPFEKPIYIFQSIYHTCKQRPFASKCSDYPYSPDWQHFEMADRAKTFILEYVKTFQAESIRAK
ncbi:BRISC and BRCA1-A complex member 2-like [Cloeon dipterum]|uniref:BRISC and BRCA1-A complex member 2-like n=1 Tax=Cloeon dipterum TaxID=197152 RepID=UPI00321FBF1E